MNEPMIEHVDSRGVAVRVDRPAGIIRGVKILGMQSRNGRIYRHSALEKSVTLYEGARVNVDHPRSTSAASRGYEDRIGAIRNVQKKPDGLYGDFHFNPKHRLAEQLLWDAEHSPENVGFSHNVLARTSRDGRRVVVEEITSVQSVDLVADPATTRGLFEDFQPSGGSAFSVDAQRWNNASGRWEPLNKPVAEQSAQLNEQLAALRSQVQTLEAENERLRGELGNIAARDAQAIYRAKVEQTIRESGIPGELITETFREQCYAAVDDCALAKLIEARVADARLLGSKPRSVEQNRAQQRDAVIDGASFAAAIR